MDTALDPRTGGMARRSGVIRTSRVQRRTTVLLVRFRYHIITRKGDNETALLAEDCQILAFAGSPQSAEWLSDDQAAGESAKTKMMSKGATKGTAPGGRRSR